MKTVTLKRTGGTDLDVKVSSGGDVTFSGRTEYIKISREEAEKLTKFLLESKPCKHVPSVTLGCYFSEEGVSNSYCVKCKQMFEFTWKAEEED
jgi:hypothetical protein